MIVAPITSALATLGAVALVALSIPVSMRRFQAKIPIGHGRDKVLEYRSRAQANFVEYVPAALIVLALAEANGAPALWVAACGGALVVGRAVHAYGMLAGGKVRPRQLGMLLTWGALLAGAAALVSRLT
jgi:uncharacterized protein